MKVTLEDIGKSGKDGYVLLCVKYNGGNGILQAEVYDRKYYSSGWHDIDCVTRIEE
jgi:hypothetical protein